MTPRMLGVFVVMSLTMGSAALAQPTDPRQTSCVLKLPGMEKVVVRQDLPFKTAGGRTLAFDLYTPAPLPTGTGAPLVVFVNGVGDPPDAPLKTWGVYQDWARLAAVSGMAAVLHNTTREKPQVDFADLIQALRSRAADLRVDPENMALWASSANVRVGFPYAMDPAHSFVKAAVFYYGGPMDPNTQRPDLPVMVGRAGLDFPATKPGHGRLGRQGPRRQRAGRPGQCAQRPSWIRRDGRS